jgi:tripartite-type tricarboxylate transporter receptor subunit TctC
VKTLFVTMCGVAALAAVTSAGASTDFPRKPARIIVGIPAGSQPDTIARLLGSRLAEKWAQPVVVHNVTGVAGSIAADRVAKAAPDGYTLGLLSQSQMVVNPALYKVAYDPIRDFAPVSQVAVSPNILVVQNGTGVKTVRELVSLAKAQPGALTFASGGSGTGPHMAAELLKSAAGIDIRHIAYKGGNTAIPDLLGGRVTMIFLPTATALPLAREGKVRAIAVSSLTRSRVAPELPTISESGYPGFEFTNWFGVLAPAKIPEAIVRKVHDGIAGALASLDVRMKLAHLGLEIVAGSPAEFSEVIRAEAPRWSKLIRQTGIKPE